MPDSPVEPSSDTAAQLVVSGSRIGPIPVDSSMGYIARLLPYTVVSSYLETTPIIGWDFHIRGLSVWGTQQDATINPALPADSWIIQGRGTVRLPGPILLGLPTVWSRLRMVVPGRTEVASGEIGTRARFCTLPRLAFPLEIGLDAADKAPSSPDSVSPSTPVTAIEVWHDDTVPCVH